MVVTKELKDFVLRKDRRLVIERAINKMKCKSGRDAISVRYLDKIANGESTALQRLNCKECVKSSLGTSGRDGISDNKSCRQKSYGKQQVSGPQTEGE